MQAIIWFRNGTKRVINLTHEFNTSTRIPVGRNSIVLTPQEKANNLMHIFGRRPYMIDVVENGKTIIKIVEETNKPYEHFTRKKNAEPQEIKTQKKELRKQFKHSTCSLVAKSLKSITTIQI